MTDDANRPPEGVSGSAPGMPSRSATQRSTYGSPHRSRSSRPTHKLSSRAERINARRRRHRLIRWSLTVAVAVLAVFSTVLLVLLLRTMTTLRSTQNRLVTDVQAEREIGRQHEQTIAGLQTELKDLVRNRLPEPLMEMVPDQLIPLQQPGLRSVLFTQVGTTEHPGYEFRLTCRNDDAERLNPRLRILLFNEAGIQTGSADTVSTDEWNRSGATGLAPGESASFSGRVTLLFDDIPRYFLILPVPTDNRLPRLAP